jgi:hypothetical protein
MIGEVSIFEFNEMFNKGKPIFSISTKKSFFDVRELDGILLIYEVQYYCRSEKTENNVRNDLDAVLDIIQRKLNKEAILVKFRRDEGMCETTYHYVFLLK